MRVLILGAGFGGMEVATCLSEALGDQVAVTLIDKSDHFVFGYSKLDVMFGKETPEAVRLPYSAFSKPGVEFRRETILSIDPERKRAVTDGGEYEADVLVVALGADLDPSATPGLREHGNEFYTEAGAARVRDVLPAFNGGNVIVGVATPHYKCPPAPSETAMLMHDYLLESGLRENSTITLVTPFPSPLPVSPEVGAAILAELTDRNIGFMPGAKITGIDESAVHLADGQSLPADLVLTVPLHVAPPVVVESGLTENGWIPTDKYTLKTRFPDVYAFGDVASVGVPRAGIFSEGQGKIVAAQIIADVQSGSASARYQGIGQCYIEFGRGTVGKVDVNFLGGPSTIAEIHLPSEALRAEKSTFGSSRRARWFGIE
jgi:sulfide:quinone oxidoreductase